MQQNDPKVASMIYDAVPNQSIANALLFLLLSSQKIVNKKCSTSFQTCIYYHTDTVFFYIQLKVNWVWKVYYKSCINLFIFGVTFDSYWFHTLSLYKNEVQEHLAKYFLLLSSEEKIWVWNDMRVVVANCHGKKKHFGVKYTVE